MSEELNLKLSVNDVNVVLAGLAELPAKSSYDMINKIKSQVVPQLTAPVSEGAEAGKQLLTEGQDGSKS